MHIQIRRVPLAVALGLCLVASACVTRPPPTAPIHFYVSWSGDDETHPETRLVFDAMDARLRTEPGFVRDFDDPVHVSLGYGVPAGGGMFRFPVQIRLPPSGPDGRATEVQRLVADFSITCAPPDATRCVNAVLHEMRAHAARMQRLLRTRRRAHRD